MREKGNQNGHSVNVGEVQNRYLACLNDTLPNGSVQTYSNSNQKQRGNDCLDKQVLESKNNLASHRKPTAAPIHLVKLHEHRSSQDGSPVNYKPEPNIKVSGGQAYLEEGQGECAPYVKEGTDGEMV